MMAYLHCRTLTWIQTPNPMATLYCTETVPIAWTRILIQIQINTVPIFGVAIHVRQCK